MKIRIQTISLWTIFISAPFINGCGMGGALGAVGNLSNLVPSGATRLTSSNDLFMDSMELTSSSMPYRIVPSSPQAASEPSPTLLYGTIGE